MRVEELDTPCLVIDLDQTERNIKEMADAAQAAGVGLRPHAKTHKTPILGRRQMEAGAIGLSLAKIGEAEVFVEAGLETIFVAFPIVGEQKIPRLMRLLERAQIMTSLDDLAVAEPLARAALAIGRRLDVLLEIDAGLHRVGVPPRTGAIEIATRLASMPGIRLRGIMTHEGHAYYVVGEERERLVRGVGEIMVETAEVLRHAGIEIEIVSLGATPSARIAMLVDGVTEIRPGTYVFYDANHIRLGVCGEEKAAATVHARVVSHAAPDRAVVDAGSKALTQDGAALGQRGLGLVKGMPGWRLDRANEEHGMLERQSDDAPALHIGQRLELIPNHICPAVNLYDQMYVARGGEVIDVWPVAARGRVQ